MGCIARRAFMPSQYRMVWVRANDEANPRRSKTRAVPDGFGQYCGPPPLLDPIPAVLGGPPISRPGTPTRFPNIPAAQVTCALLVEFNKLPIETFEIAHRRQFLIRGLPQDMINGNVVNTGAASFTLMRTFLDYLGNHEVGHARSLAQRFWSIRYNTPVQPKDYAITGFVPVVAPGNPRTVNVTAPGCPAVTRGKRMQITGIFAPINQNRIWTALADGAAGGPYLLGTQKKIIPAGYDGSGRIRPVNYSYGPPDQYLIVGMRIRDTGRPFRLTRGRRRVL